MYLGIIYSKGRWLLFISWLNEKTTPAHKLLTEQPMESPSGEVTNVLKSKIIVRRIRTPVELVRSPSDSCLRKTSLFLKLWVK